VKLRQWTLPFSLFNEIIQPREYILNFFILLERPFVTLHTFHLLFIQESLQQRETHTQVDGK
jgi:hypothetical protein